MTNDEASIVKGMLARGDKQQWIVAWFGGDLNPGRIAEISTGQKFDSVKAATSGLPPRGPYSSGQDAHKALMVLKPALEAQLAITERIAALHATSERHCKSIQAVIDVLQAGKK